MLEKRSIVDKLKEKLICGVIGHKMIISYTSIEDESYFWKHKYCCRCGLGCSETTNFEEEFGCDEDD